MTTYVALLRAIGPATHRVMSMGALRERCVAAGLADVSTYVATGNLLCRSAAGPHEVQAIVQSVVASFALDNAVIVRTGVELSAALAGNPFPAATADHPQAVAVCFLAEGTPEFGWLGTHGGNERVTVADRLLYIDYPMQISQARLTLGRVERRLGIPMTARNWNTLRNLVRLTSAMDASG